MTARRRQPNYTAPPAPPALPTEGPKELTLSRYQEFARRTKVYRGDIYPYLGLCSEAGEVAQEMKRQLRDNYSGELGEERVAAIRKELGDVLWYVAAIADDLEIDLGEIAMENLVKLASRKERGALTGQGGDR